MIQHIQESRKTSEDHDSSKRYKLVGRGLATIDRLPAVSLVLASYPGHVEEGKVAWYL